VQAPTLLIVGGEDHVVIDLNRTAFDQLRSEKQLDIVPGATHLFEEPGALEEVARLAGQLSGWEVAEGHHLSKGYEFANFAEALDFVNRVGRVAEAEGHHPDISFGWGYARLRIYTHAIDGLTESDFILAAKIDEL
jgi:4a-hydroxytetrahydrobiopterin dehydratase